MILTQLTDRTKVLLTMMMSSFVTPFTSSALTLSLPDIGRDYGASANELGWVLEIFLLASNVCLLPMGKLADRHSPTRIATVGMAITALGILGLVAVVHFESLWLVVPVVVIIGIGFALFAAPNNNAIMGAVPKRYYSLATSMIGTVRLVGQVISVAIVTMVLSLDWNWLPQLEGLVRNIEISFIVFTLLCLIGILPSVARRARGTER